MSPAQIFDCIQCILTYVLFLYIIQKILDYKINPVIPIISFTALDISAYYLLCYSETLTKIIPEETRMVLKTIVMISIMIVFALFVCKGKIIKKIQAVLILNISIFIVEAIQSVFYVTVFDFSASEFNIDLKTRIITGSIALFFYCLAAIFTYFICKHKELKIEPKVFAVITSLFLLIAFLYTLVMASSVHSTSLLTTILSIFSAFTVMILMLILCRIMIQANNQEVLKEKLFWSENLQTLQLDYYNSIKEKSKETRQIRHDLKDQLETVKKLVNKNTEESIETATDILNELNNKVDSTSFHFYTENLIVNTIIGIKIEECKNTNIQWDVKLDLPETIPSIENIDLNCLFINLLNNAVEACLKLDGTKTQIVVRATTKSNYLIIKIENTFKEITTNPDGKLITTKNDKNNHGVGTILIENIAKKYNGFYEVNTENDIFKSIVTIPYDGI